MYCCSTVNIYMVLYQYFYYFYFHEVNLQRYICCYFLSTYNNPLILVMFYIKLSRNLYFLSNIEPIHLWYLQTQLFRTSQRNPQPLDFNQQQQVQKPNSCYLNQYTTGIRSTIRGQSIVVSYILTHTQISWFQAISYCTHSVRAITLVLKMAYSVFQSLI